MSFSSPPLWRHARSGASRSHSCCCGALFATAAIAEELPTLKRGMWQFDRTVNGREMGVITQCANPTADMKEQNAMLTAAGCNFSPVRQDGDKYIFDVDVCDQVRIRPDQFQDDVGDDRQRRFRVQRHA